MKRLKIGLVLDDSLDSNDGVQQYIRTLGAWLTAQGHTVHYLVGQTRTSDKTVHSLSRNVAVRFNRNRLTIPLPANLRTIKELLKKEAYDVLHVQMPYSPFMAGKIIARASLQTAVVGTFHILPYGQLQRYGSQALGAVQRYTLQRFDAVCSVSPAAQAFAFSKFKVSSVVIPNMIDLASWKTPIQPHPGRIVFLGRLVHRKGCVELLQAIAALPKARRAKLEVLIAGDGPERQKLQKLASHLGLKQVTFLGYIAESDKASLLASAELAVFPSLGGESFGIVLIEAMAAGAGVVIGGNNPGYQSVLADWPQTLVNPKDTNAFSAAIDTFLTDKALRQSVHRAQQSAVARYNTEVVGLEILELYDAALLHRRLEMR